MAAPEGAMSRHPVPPPQVRESAVSAGRQLLLEEEAPLPLDLRRALLRRLAGRIKDADDKVRAAAVSAAGACAAALLLRSPEGLPQRDADLLASELLTRSATSAQPPAAAGARAQKRTRMPNAGWPRSGARRSARRQPCPWRGCSAASPPAPTLAAPATQICSSRLPGGC